MRAARFLIGFVLLIPITLWAIGSFLDETYEATLRLTLDAPAEAIFEEMLDYENNPVTGRMFQKATPLDPVDGLPSWRETIGGSSVRVTTLESVPPKRLKLQFQDEGLPMSAILEIDLAPRAGSTAITATNRTTVKGGGFYAPLFRLTLATVGGLERGLFDYFDKLARNLDVEPEYQMAR